MTQECIQHFNISIILERQFKVDSIILTLTLIHKTTIMKTSIWFIAFRTGTIHQMT
jgi:hypothetical protein